MEILFLWLSTSITSICMEMAYELRMFKDVADAGYKIDTKRISDLNKQLNPDAPKATLLSLLIPIFNIIQVFQRTVQYNNARSMILDQLNAMDALKEMSEIEKEEYSKNPTGLNALIVQTKMEIRLLNAEKLTIDDENEKSEFIYEMNGSLKDITILKVSGDAAKLTVEEQKEKIANSFRKMVSAVMEKYGDKESFVNALRNNTNLDLSHSSDNKKEENVEPVKLSKLSIDEQKQALENLRNKLIEKQQKSQKSQSHTESEPTLTKKRK